MNHVVVVGLGLAGSEAAWQLAQRGVRVIACEMRPAVSTPAHRTDRFAELVCSNSLRSDEPSTAPGLLKAELRKCDSLILRMAGESRVPAGAAFAVDRESFSANVTDAISSHPNIEVRRVEVRDLDENLRSISGGSIALIASGPLTGDALFESIHRRLGARGCFFFDAIAPRVMAESVDASKGFWASRYGKGSGPAGGDVAGKTVPAVRAAMDGGAAGGDYFNCPMTRDEYVAFREALVSAKTARPHLPGESKARFFEGCLPVEEMARRGEDTMRHGPMKPVGLPGDHYAVVQLRKDNREGTILGLVGFQTSLTHGEQDRVFRMIPALAHAEFAQRGAMHLNRYIHAPSCLDATLKFCGDPALYFAGQLCGVEGYVESCATGLAAAVHIARALAGEPAMPFPPETAIGALCHAICDPARVLNFQPQNINFGILAGSPKEPREKRTARALESLSAFLTRFPDAIPKNLKEIN